MQVKVLGAGCAKCKKLYAETERAIEQAGVDAALEKVESIDDILEYGVMMTPALVIDGAVVSMGKAAPARKIVGWLTAAAAKE